MYKFNEVAKFILETDYLLPKETPEEMLERVSNTISSVEDTEDLKEYWNQRFLHTLKDGTWMCATPFLMNSGVNNMFSSCFVIGGLNDNLKDIFTVAERVANVTKMGGGVGLNISKLREKGSLIRSTKGESSGAVSFMKIFDATLSVVKQARRRGAGIIVMDIYHPEIEDFIDIKSDHSLINHFNISVLVDDDFMNAVKNNKNITLKSPLGSEVKRVNAKDLFNKIVYNARYHSEPGIIFKTTINKDNPCLYNLGAIDSVNACVTEDTTILTDCGYKNIKELVGKEVNVWNGEEFSKVIPQITGNNQEIYDIKFSDGSKLACTTYHKFYIKNNYRKPSEVVEAKNLKIGDKLEKFSFPIIEGNLQEDNKKMYTMGVYAGYGFIDKEKRQACIYLYGEKKKLLSSLDYRIFNDNNDSRILVKLNNQYLELDKLFVPTVNYTINNRLNWLSGIIDTDGSLNSSDGSITITSISENFLCDIKYMLNTMGSNATINLMKKAVNRMLPDGNGGKKEYFCQNCYRLTINAGNIKKLIDLGLQTNRVLLSANPNRDASKFITIKSIIKRDNLEKNVYCFNEPIKHRGCFNGIVTGQCGEIPLYDDEACNLSSINLRLMVNESKEIDEEKLKYTVETIVRFLDNSIDLNNYPDEQIDKAVLKTRKLGIGVMGLNDLLTKMGLEYDSEKGRKTAKKVMSLITTYAQNYSCELINQGRSLPEAWYGSTFEKNNISIRNLSVTSGQPTGATQILLDEICSSAGIEPYFAIAYKRRVREETFDLVNSLFKEIGEEEGWFSDELVAKILNNNGSCQGIKEVPKRIQKLFKTSTDISWESHVKMQSELQGVTTNSLSKTINMPSKSTVEDVYNAFMMAWETGCKGTTVYVQNSRSDQVLSSETNDSLCYELDNITPISRSILGETAGTTIDKRSACGKMFITINRDKHGNIVESFVNVGKTGICKSNIDGINRLLSLALRSGIKVDEIVDQLMGIVCQGCVKAKAKDGKIDGNSCPDIIAKVLKEKYYATLKDNTKNETANGNFKCPECGELTLSKYDGCVHCTNCTYQKCS